LQGRYDEAEELYTMVIAGQTDLAGDSKQTLSLATTRLMLGEMYEEMGRLEEARGALKGAVKGLEYTLGKKTPQAKYAKERLVALGSARPKKAGKPLR
jgi:tetratricopeptide (TPR) repeat protein